MKKPKNGRLGMVAPAVVTPPPASQEPLVVLRVEDPDRMHLLIAASELRAANAEAYASSAMLDALLAQVDKDGKVKKALENASQAMQRAQARQAEYQRRVSEVEAKLGLPLEGMSMDPESGIVRPIEPELSRPAPPKTA